MTVRGCGIRDIAIIASVSIGKVLSTIGSSVYKIAPKKRYYERLEVDEFWTYVYRKMSYAEETVHLNLVN